MSYDADLEYENNSETRPDSLVETYKNFQIYITYPSETYYGLKLTSTNYILSDNTIDEPNEYSDEDVKRLFYFKSVKLIKDTIKYVYNECPEEFL